MLRKRRREDYSFSVGQVTELSSRTAFSLLSLVLFLSCSAPCDEAGLQVIRDAESGNVAAVKQYLENGGDPLFSCTEGASSGGPYGFGIAENSLPAAVMYSNSYELIGYYLSRDLPATIPDGMLQYFSTDDEAKSGKIIRLLIQKGAHITETANICCASSTCFTTVKNISSYDEYDLDWVDPEDGNTLFMKYAACPAPDAADVAGVLAIMQFLADKGVKTDLKNKEGKTALALAVNPKIKQFLKKL